MAILAASIGAVGALGSTAMGLFGGGSESDFRSGQLLKLQKLWATEDREWSLENVRPYQEWALGQQKDVLGNLISGSQGGNMDEINRMAARETGLTVPAINKAYANAAERAKGNLYASNLGNSGAMGQTMGNLYASQAGDVAKAYTTPVTRLSEQYSNPNLQLQIANLLNGGQAMPITSSSSLQGATSGYNALSQNESQANSSAMAGLGNLVASFTNQNSPNYVGNFSGLWNSGGSNSSGLMTSANNTNLSNPEWGYM